MREIKFRAYHIEQEKMINIENILSFSNDGDIWINENKQMPLNVFSGWASKDFKLMQYTGLKDKNGVEIYEGDIVNYRIFGICEVRYYKNSFVLWSKDGDFSRGYLAEDVEVIGNIYENKELLNTKGEIK